MKNTEKKDIQQFVQKLRDEDNPVAKDTVKEYYETDIRPGEYLHPWPVRIGFRISNIFGHGNKYAEFKATTHTRHFRAKDGDEEFIIENIPTPQTVQKCADAIARAYVRKIEAKPHEPYDGVIMSNDDGEDEYISFIDLEKHLSLIHI